jgi:hypothetical protein
VSCQSRLLAVPPSGHCHWLARLLNNPQALGNAELYHDNACLSTCSGLHKLPNQIDDGESGPGPGLDGVPDVGWMITKSGNLRGCNNLGELFEVIFFGSLECE